MKRTARLICHSYSDTPDIEKLKAVIVKDGLVPAMPRDARASRGHLAESLSEFFAFSYFLSTEYEESGLSATKLHVGVVDGSVFNPRTGVH